MPRPRRCPRSRRRAARSTASGRAVPEGGAAAIAGDGAEQEHEPGRGRDRDPRPQTPQTPSTSPRSLGLRACLAGAPKPPDQFRRLLVPAEARHDVRPGYLTLGAGQEVQGHSPGPPRRPVRRRRASPRAARSGIVMPGTSLWRNSAWRALWSGSTPSSTGTGKPPGPKRSDAGQHRLHLLRGVERLGHDQVRAGRELALQPGHSLS